MRIKRLAIKNFKGISSLEITPAGSGMSIYGDNATGKTTVFDAFTWLLFGKDSLNSAQFEIKPIGGERGVETIVEAELYLGDSAITLKKVYSEKWVKRRGSAQAEFTGHSIDHFVNGVPTKKGEFDKAVSEICNPSLFKTLSNPRHVNEVLTWQERRGMLMDMFGDLPDEAVIASDTRLEELPSIIGKHSLDDYRKIIKARMPEINRELAKIPVRIDEVQSTLADKPRDLKTVQGVLAHLQATRHKKQAELAQAESGGALAELTKQLREAEAALQKHDTKAEALAAKAKIDADNRAAAAERTIAKLQAEIDTLAGKVRQCAPDIDSMYQSILGLQKAQVVLRTRWAEENSKQFTYASGDTCPTCGQPMPADQVDAARKTAEAEFNTRKAETLSQIRAIGTQNKQGIKELEDKIAGIVAVGLELEKEIALKATQIKQVRDELSNIEPKPIDESALQARATLVAAVSEIETAMVAAREESNAPALTAKIAAEIAEIDTQVEALQREIIGIENSATSKARIEQLKAEERKLAAEYERLERELSIADRFVRAKVSMLEDKINGHFELARWKMFDEQINGGLQDCCEMSVNGVPYWNLNNAMRVQAGLDVTRALQKHHGKSIPVWIDNREGITTIPKMDCQVISLIVSENDKTLRVEEN